MINELMSFYSGCHSIKTANSWEHRKNHFSSSREHRKKHQLRGEGEARRELFEDQAATWCAAAWREDVIMVVEQCVWWAAKKYCEDTSRDERLTDLLFKLRQC